MGVAFKAPRNTKTEAFKLYLESYEKSNILCSLNEIFDINFPMSDEYLNATEEDKVTYIGVVLQYLACLVSCFNKII